MAAVETFENKSLKWNATNRADWNQLITRLFFWKELFTDDYSSTGPELDKVKHDSFS